MKKVIKIFLAVLLVILLCAAVFVGWLTVKEFKPDAIEPAMLKSSGESETLGGDSLKLVSWNIGYSGLGKDASFILDGGKGNGKPETREILEGYYEGISKALKDMDADVYMLQEVDSGSDRSYKNNQIALLQGDLSKINGAYANNYVCPFVPFPIPPIGAVNSGLLTLSDLEFSEATRYALPSPFTWPMSAANLKRCLLLTRIPLPDKDAELVVINLHLEAYDDGEGKAAQTDALLSLLEEEFKKGNYVIAGGDFNQAFPETTENFPILDSSFWTPGELGDMLLPEGFSYVFDGAAPTCRLLNAPYSGAGSGHQFFVIDGFIVSSNIETVSVLTNDLDFAYSDHNPVVLEVKLLDS